MTRLLFIFTALLVANSILADTRRQARAAQCVVGGVRYNDGELFVIKFSGHCMQFKCVKDIHILDKYLCTDKQGNCYKHGDIRDHSECIQLICNIDANSSTFKIYKKACFFKGRCVEINDVIQDGCVSYRCKEDSNGAGSISLGMFVDKVGCMQSNGDCVPEGETIRCGSLRCERRGNAGGLFPVAVACPDNETKECHSLGSVWETSNCKTLRCDKYTKDPNDFSSIEQFVSASCKDDQGRCHKPDGTTRYVKTINGQRVNCVCRQNSASAQSVCEA